MRSKPIFKIAYSNQKMYRKGYFMASYKNLINVIDISDLIVLNVSVADIVT
jgi:hypothetical protein